MLEAPLSNSQVKNIILSMAGNESVPIYQIQHFFENFLIRKAIPTLDLNIPFLIRCSPNEPGEVFNHIKRCYYHPIPEKIPLQRANYPFQQVFYAAVPSNGNLVSGDMTALLESTMDKVKNKQITRYYLTLSRWNLNRPLKVFALPFTRRSADRNKDFKIMSNEYDNLLLEICNGDKYVYHFIRNFLSFISDTFCQKNKKQFYYRISASFYNAIMEINMRENFGMDGLLYPSANSKAAGMNIALKKDVVDDRSVFIDHVVTYVMQRNPTNPKDINYFPVSDGVCPDSMGKFCFAYIN
jgi:hypothetical protein